MSWFNIIRKESDARWAYETYGTYTPQDIIDDDDELDSFDIKETLKQILSEFAHTGNYQKNKVYKIDKIVQDMKTFLQEIERGDDVGIGYEFYFNTGQVLREEIDNNRLKNTIVELLTDFANFKTTSEAGYMMGGDSFKVVDIYEEPYNEMESYFFQSEEELRRA